MKKKTYALVQGCISGAATIATAIVTYAQPSMAVAIVAGIGIAATAINEICALFVKSDE